MKTFKFCMALIACVLISNFAMAEKLSDESKKSNLADLIIDKLDKDVKLSNSQKTALKAYSIEFIGKMENAHNKTVVKEKQDNKNLAYKEFEAVLDSILTSNQREIRKLKIQERANAVNTKK